jgi:hypothetical protein
MNHPGPNADQARRRFSAPTPYTSPQNEVSYISGGCAEEGPAPTQRELA